MNIEYLAGKSKFCYLLIFSVNTKIWNIQNGDECVHYKLWVHVMIAYCTCTRSIVKVKLWNRNSLHQYSHTPLVSRASFIRWMCRIGETDCLRNQYKRNPRSHSMKDVHKFRTGTNDKKMLITLNSCIFVTWSSYELDGSGNFLWMEKMIWAKNSEIG